MKRIIQATIAAAVLFAGVLMIYAPKPVASDDLATLREIVDIQIPASSGRWEIFGTPEQSGLVPGPTDFTTLVAEFNAGQAWFDANTVPAGVVYIGPISARPWITTEFRQILDRNKDTRVDLSSRANCRKYATTLKKTGAPVGGFVCSTAGRTLMYLDL